MLPPQDREESSETHSHAAAIDMAVALVTYAYFVAAFFVAVLVYRTFLDHATPLPPGPRRLPLVGNALEPISRHAEQTFSAWAKQYGERYSYFRGLSSR